MFPACGCLRVFSGITAATLVKDLPQPIQAAIKAIQYVRVWRYPGALLQMAVFQPLATRHACFCRAHLDREKAAAASLKDQSMMRLNVLAAETQEVEQVQEVVT